MSRYVGRGKGRRKNTKTTILPIKQQSSQGAILTGVRPNTRPLILITEPEYFTLESIRMMKRVGVVWAKRLPQKELAKIITQVTILVVRVETKLDASLLKLAANLRCVVSATTGTNHLDIKYLASKNIPLFHLSGVHSLPTAEHAIAMLLSAARRIPFAHRDLEKSIWKRWEHIGTQIEGKTLGIIGIGRIGSQVAKKAQGLGMNVIAYDPNLSAAEISAKKAGKVPLERLLRKSDFITIHAPLTGQTKDMIDARAFKKMKASAILINTARGAIVNTNALVQALKNKTIAAAAFDVYEKEPLSKDNPLPSYAKNNANLVLTPHIAASTNEAVAEASLFSANTVIEFVKKKSSTNAAHRTKTRRSS
jgi:D-3-phosphoglycerate dehydrogenase